MKKFVVLFACAVVVSACSPSPRSLEKQLGEIFETYEGIGLSVVAVKDGKTVFAKDFGVKDIETGEKIDGNSLYRIASISKSFTATAIMQLIDRGLVSLDTDASQIAGFPVRNPRWPDKVITVEMLLSHTSSVCDDVCFNSFDSINPDVCPEYAGSYLDFEPGTQFNYCDLNFNILGTFVERLTGERFDNYIRNHILEPMGIVGGFCADSLNRGDFAKIYRYDEQGLPVEQTEAYVSRKPQLDKYVVGHDAPVFSASGGIKMSAAGLAKVMKMHINYGLSEEDGVRIISEESSKAMQVSHSGDAGYGLGFGRTEPFYEDIPTYGHTGGAYGLNSVMCFDQSRRFGVVAICSGSQKPEGVEKNILQTAVPVVFHWLEAQ